MFETASHHVHVDGHPTCPCGQELDTCRRAHCPRCGHRLAPQLTPQLAPVG